MHPQPATSACPHLCYTNPNAIVCTLHPQVYDMTVSISAGGQTLETRVYRIVEAGFGGSFKGLAGNTYSLLPAAPEDACSGLGNSLLQGNIVLVKRGGGNCPFIDKARAAQSAGGAGVIITNNVQEGYFAMKASGSGTVSIPTGGVPLSVGRCVQGRLLG